MSSGNSGKKGLVGCVILLFIAAISIGCLNYDNMRHEDSDVSSKNLQNNVCAQEESTAVQIESGNIGETNTEINTEISIETNTETNIKTETNFETKIQSYNESGTNHDIECRTDENDEMLLETLTLEEKVSQLFFVTPESLLDSDTITIVDENMRQAIEKYPVGGIVLFAKNLVSKEQTATMIADMQSQAKEVSGISLFMGIDEEGGIVQRIGGKEGFDIPKTEPMGKLAKNNDVDLIYEAGYRIGKYLADLGFNVDFAPVADVITNQENTVIGERSFGTKPEMVSEMAWAFARGLNENNVLVSYKHFPGHGGTVEDSHAGYAYSHKTIEELKASELIPFYNAVEKNVDFIMIGHISLPNVTGGDVPASLSHLIVTELLREEMGYQGIIITDALNMGAVCDNYTSDEAAVSALLAGCDMILMPEDFELAYEGVLEAVRTGRLTEERIDESVLRILKAKNKEFLE